MSWILVMYIYAGAFAKGDSVTLQAVDGFSNKAKCEEAGKLGNGLVGGSAKEYKFVCLPKS